MTDMQCMGLPIYCSYWGQTGKSICPPILFTAYLDVLLLRLRNSNVGCHVGSYFCGTFAHVDDLLLSPPYMGCRPCLKYVFIMPHSTNFCFQFCTFKSRMVVFSNALSVHCDPLNFMGGATKAVKYEKHLGILSGPRIKSGHWMSL